MMRRIGIVLALFGVALGVEVLVESPAGQILGPFGGLCNALAGGLLLILKDLYGLVVILVSFLVGIPVFTLLRRTSASKYIVWPLTGLIAVTLAFVSRMGLAVGVVGASGTLTAALISGASGAISGAILARFISKDYSEAYRAILGLCLSALYHFEIATTWTTGVSGLPGLVLGVGEFLAPAAFGLVMGVWLR